MAEPALSTERLRRQNVSLVLRSCAGRVRRPAPSSPQRTGLAKATVGAIVADLEDARAVTEEESRAGGRGRPGRPVALRGDRFLALGLELNVDYVAAVVLDLAGRVQVVETRPTTPEVLAREQALLDLVRDVVLPCLGRPRPGRRHRWPSPASCGPTTAPSPGRPNLARLAATRLVGRLEVRSAAAARCGSSNDANCAAYAETHHGAATDSATCST